MRSLHVHQIQKFNYVRNMLTLISGICELASAKYINICNPPLPKKEKVNNLYLAQDLFCV